MMFWKFQTHHADPAETTPVFMPAPTPTSPAPEQIHAPVPPPDVAEPVAAPVPAPVPAPPPVEPEDPAGYEQAAERTMRFLADMLSVPSWVLFKNQDGRLGIIAAIGDYRRYLPADEIEISQLSELPTINLLAAPSPTVADADRREGGVDPATVAPFGLPLVDADDNLFGVLCALGEQSAAVRAALARPLLDYSASMLGALVRSELTLEEATRRTERAQADAMVDPLTGLRNRRAWDQLLVTEDQRCSRHGYDAVVFVVDLDGLKATNDRFGHEKGDELIRNAAAALERCVRRTDVVARVGGDEFSILAVKCDANAASRIREHIESTLLRANAPATVGFSVRSEAGDLFEAWRQADGAMYHRKRGNPRSGQRATEEQLLVEASASPKKRGARPKVTESTRAPQAPAQPQAPAESPAPQSAEGSAVAQILEKVLPALVAGIQKATPPRTEPAPPQPAPTPPTVEKEAAAAPARPTARRARATSARTTRASAGKVAETAPAAPAPEPAPPEMAEPPGNQLSEDLVDIVSRLSRLSETDRRLLGVFVKGSR